MGFLEIPAGVTEIGDYAFSSNALTSVALPDTLLKIGNCAFANGFVYDEQMGNRCVSVPDSVIEIGAGAFKDCFLQDIKLPNQAKLYGLFAFLGNNLSSVIFPEGVESLTTPAIMGNEKLNRLYLPKSLKELSPLSIAKDGYGELHTMDSPYEVDSYWFSDLVMVSDIYFAGTETEWNVLIKDWDFAKYNTDPSVMDNVSCVHFNATVARIKP